MNTSTNIVTHISPIPSICAVQLLIEDTDTHKANYEDATDKEAWLQDKYHKPVLIDALLEDYNCDEIARMMSDEYVGCFDSALSFVIEIVRTGYFGDISSALERYIDYDKLAQDLLRGGYYYEIAGSYYYYKIGGGYYYYEIAGECYFFRIS